MPSSQWNRSRQQQQQTPTTARQQPSTDHTAATGQFDSHGSSSGYLEGLEPLLGYSEQQLARMNSANEAIAYARAMFPEGAGNQAEDLQRSNFNSYFRSKTAEDENNAFFNLPPEVQALAEQNPMAFEAAKAELAGGGNCGHHAAVVFDYLRQTMPDEHIQIVQSKGIDHAYVLIGDPKDPENLIAVDAWAKEGGASKFQDHFLHRANPEDILTLGSSQGDATDYKQQMLDMGLSLNAAGKENIRSILTDQDTEEALQEGFNPSDPRQKWIWDIQSSLREGASAPSPDVISAATDSSSGSHSGTAQSSPRPSMPSAPAWSFEEETRERTTRAQDDFTFDFGGSAW